ncbi:1-aminocyclopropane-1-carboxylate deaminase/D-cysteine desulfhydrase [Spongiimicrobium salis]|uniref:1-aminocyclopropane-1-carboxylate deaminase/D-cysteine desulfhydrase n=1 Tax=Spongiimicrobium salis TaxID=1667022 RepID=UPI00374D2EC7
MNLINQNVQLPILAEKQVALQIKREDLIHPLISGNKYRKLKYNIAAAQTAGKKTLLTFGGAYSNHIAATAYAGKLHQLHTIGIIRGEELEFKWKDNPTLRLASEHGMRFKFVDRKTYRNKEDSSFLEDLGMEFGDFYQLPEGGTNALAVKGCEEILNVEDHTFDIIATSVGTGGTLSGIINAAKDGQKVLGFPALKGDFLKEDICKFVRKDNWELCTSYHFGGYAKVTPDLIRFINDFKKQTQIPLDPIYTGKMVYGILDMIKHDYFKPQTKVLVIHTGGLQGIAGMNRILAQKKMPLLH